MVLTFNPLCIFIVKWGQRRSTSVKFLRRIFQAKRWCLNTTVWLSNVKNDRSGLSSVYAFHLLLRYLTSLRNLKFLVINQKSIEDILSFSFIFLFSYYLVKKNKNDLMYIASECILICSYKNEWCIVCKVMHCIHSRFKKNVFSRVRDLFLFLKLRTSRCT